MGKIIGIVKIPKTENVSSKKAIGYVTPEEAKNYINKNSVSSTDANNDGEVNLLDLVRAKKVTANSPSVLKEYNSQATQQIQDYIISPSSSYDKQMQNILNVVNTGVPLSKVQTNDFYAILNTAINDTGISKEQKAYYEAVKDYLTQTQISSIQQEVKSEQEKWTGINRQAYNSAMQKLRESGNGEPTLTLDETQAISAAVKRGIMDYAIESNLYKAQTEAAKYNPSFWDKLGGDSKLNPVAVNLKNSEKAYELLQDKKFTPSVNEISDTVKQQSLLMTREELKKAADKQDLQRQKARFSVY